MEGILIPDAPLKPLLKEAAGSLRLRVSGSQEDIWRSSLPFAAPPKAVRESVQIFLNSQSYPQLQNAINQELKADILESRVTNKMLEKALGS